MPVHRLTAHARLDDPATALDRARAEAADGDESWGQWVNDYERGDAVVISVEVSVEFGDGAREVVRGRSDGLFVELSPRVPHVERQIAELASGDLVTLADELAALGHRVDVDELSEMYVHVELDPSLREALARRGEGSASAPA
jgi:hypothetical protein